LVACIVGCVTFLARFQSGNPRGATKAARLKTASLMAMPFVVGIHPDTRTGVRALRRTVQPP